MSPNQGSDEAAVHPSTGAMPRAGENEEIAHLLEETADLLEAQRANEFRVRAYRDAAEELRQLDAPVREIWRREGSDGLTAIPRIGTGLARAIETWLETGTLGIHLRLRGEDAAERVLMTVPGIGSELARRIHRELHISTLEDLERAAHDGRLGSVPGIGERRLQSIRDQLDARLRRRGGRPARSRDRVTGPGEGEPGFPGVSELLDVDLEYRERAARDDLPRIAPRRFNPTGEAWLPILHTHRDGRHYTALFSNTERAHQLGRTHDWVVIHLESDEGESQWTVVTERRGALGGRRVIRGHEAECESYYSTATRKRRRSAPD